MVAATQNNISWLKQQRHDLDAHRREELREKYFLEMMNRVEKHTGTQNLIQSIQYKRSYCIKDFENDYHAFKGNAYGLANTLNQTAVLKPSSRNKKVKNLWYTGQLTVPGPGVPPAVISGKIVAKQLENLNQLKRYTQMNSFKIRKNEKTV